MLRSILESIPIFSSLGDTDLNALSNYAYTQIVPKGTTVVRQGDPGDALYVILSGRVKVYTLDHEGTAVTLRYMQAGDYFGELSVLDCEQRSASVETLETCNLAIIPSGEFGKILNKSPAMAIQLSLELSRRLRLCTQTLHQLHSRHEAGLNPGNDGTP
ncbi:MAG: cyclic nucleotide-binding domain-containing protein [Gammaproteobacteria bacterium]|nr:cyclic nucleotide-binding domain-containing protein [Gammaproteobacteria bacterium]MDH5801925.1 cyclic nucleotide-binding domain-containing protein [Gammaproteobacteria bacterium]